jgi:hypothetical protein
MSANSAEILAIQQLIHHFANCFDLKDWPGLESCLLPSLAVDYSDLRGTPPGSRPAAEYVELRRAALQELKTHHLCGNHEVSLDGKRASCRTSMIIHRLDPGQQDSFTTHCYYLFSLQRTPGGWKIGGVKQTILWNEGNPSIHRGVK